MKKTPHTWPALLHATLGSTSRTLRAVVLLTGVSLLAGGSPDLFRAVAELLHR
jgi:hypothetical protein